MAARSGVVPRALAVLMRTFVGFVKREWMTESMSRFVQAVMRPEISEMEGFGGDAAAAKVK